MPQGELVTLNYHELQQAHETAERRNRNKEKHGVTSKKAGKMTELEAHQIGCEGEEAAAKYYGTVTDKTILIGPDDGVDLIVGDHTCQCKTRTTVGWAFALIGTDPNEMVCDYGILIYKLDVKRFRIHGVITKKLFHELGHIQNYIRKPGGDRWAVEPEHFSPPHTLVQSTADEQRRIALYAADHWNEARGVYVTLPKGFWQKGTLSPSQRP